jgi:hypothetical protein
MSCRRIHREGRVTYVVHAHRTILDALEYAETRKAWPRHLCSSLRTDEPSFHGTPDWKSALDLARLGWPEGRAMLRKAFAVMPPAAIQDRAVQWEMAGGYPDVGRAVAGTPDCMVDDTPAELRPTRAVRVVVSIATPWTTNLAEFVNRGAAILSAVEASEAAGHRVEVAVEETVVSMDSGFSASILLKSAGHPADRDALAFFLIHPASLRRIFFALLETEQSLVHLCGGYGRPDMQPESLRPPGSVYLRNFQTGDFATQEMALTKVRSAFASVGCAVRFTQ